MPPKPRQLGAPGELAVVKLNEAALAPESNRELGLAPKPWSATRQDQGASDDLAEEEQRSEPDENNT
jgi:hypothetical protein